MNQLLYIIVRPELSSRRGMVWLIKGFDVNYEASTCIVHSEEGYTYRFPRLAINHISTRKYSIEQYAMRHKVDVLPAIPILFNEEGGNYSADKTPD